MSESKRCEGHKHGRFADRLALLELEESMDNARLEWRVVDRDGVEESVFYDASNAQDILDECQSFDAAKGPYRVECRAVLVGPWAALNPGEKP